MGHPPRAQGVRGDPLIDAADVAAAAERLDGVTVRTPAIPCPALGAGAVLKGEHLQHTGSFKLRGAWNAVARLPDDVRAGGVAATSSGNFAQALAYAAKRAGIPATILMPSDAPQLKLDATRSHGAEVVLYDRYTGDRDALAAALAAERGATLLHPYDHDDVIAGQGTAGVELLDDAGPFDVVVVQVGGGGLIAGIATIVAAKAPGTRVVGVEPAAGDDVAQSLAAGRRVTIAVPHTIADGQQTTAPGTRTFPIIQRHVAEVVTVTDDEIVDAMRLLRDAVGVVAEPSGACAAAAVLAGKAGVRPDDRVGIIVSGGNIAPDRFEALVAG